MRKLLRSEDFRIAAARAFEDNILFDTADGALRARREIVRVRYVNGGGLLTYKAPGKDGGRYKSREEIETGVANASNAGLILQRLGYRPSFRYQKYRTEYRRKGEAGTVTLDETPIGNFLEVEGAPRWIDATTKRLGFSRSDYITQSYVSLFMIWQREHGRKPGDMIFPPAKKSKPKSALKL